MASVYELGSVLFGWFLETNLKTSLCSRGIKIAQMWYKNTRFGRFSIEFRPNVWF